MSRVALNIAITAMVIPNRTSINDIAAVCQRDEIIEKLNSSSETRIEQENENFDWTNRQSGLMLGGYFYGYALMMPFAGYITKYFGVRNTISIGLLLSSFLTFSYSYILYIPTYGFYFGFLIRVLIGFVHSPAFPALQGMWTEWAPEQEKSRLVCALFLGAPFGSVFIALIGGRLGHAFGWKSLFDFSAAMNLLCGLLFFILVRNTPLDHPYISTSEKKYIMETRNQQKKTQKRPPYSKMLKSLPYLAISAAHVTHLYSMYTFIQLFAKYLGDVQGKNIKEIGALASLPQALTVVLILFGSHIADWLHSKGYKWIYIRRGLNSIGSILPGLFCFLYFFVGCNTVAVIAFAMITQTLMGFQVPASKANLNDICPLYVAHAMSLMNTVASCTGFIAPAIAGELLDTMGNNHKSWGIVWSISGFMLIAGGIFYAIFSDGKIQDWAMDEDGDDLSSTIDEKTALKDTQ